MVAVFSPISVLEGKDTCINPRKRDLVDPRRREKSREGVGVEHARYVISRQRLLTLTARNKLFLCARILWWKVECQVLNCHHATIYPVAAATGDNRSLFVSAVC